MWPHIYSEETSRFYIPIKTIIIKLQAIEIKDIEFSHASWTKDNTDTTNSPVVLPILPPEWSFHPEHNNKK